MKPILILVGTLVLVAFVVASSIASEVAWSTNTLESEKTASLRELVGLPSVAVGNLNPSARNPGLEIFCTSIYDVPGGYCDYFTSGVPHLDLKVANITASDDK
jgi:hypothetical protein